MERLLEQFTPRTLALCMAAAIALTLLAAYLYVFQKPLKMYVVTTEAMTELAADPELDQRWDDEIKRLENEIEILDTQLYGRGPRLPVNQMVAYVIGELDLAAARRRITLVSVQPAEVSRIFEFDEVPFLIEVKGGYFDLVEWLRDVEQRLGAMVVKQFEIAPAGTTTHRNMRLTMASFRPAEESRWP